MNGIDAVSPPDMVDRVHFRGIRIDTIDPVSDNRIVFPASFEQLVDGLHVLFGKVITVVMFDLTVESHRPRSAVEIAGDYIPSCPALGEVIERREATGEKIRILIGRIRGDAEADILRHRSHHRHDKQRIVDRDLHRILDRGSRRSAIYVIDADDVGEEDRVKQAALGGTGQMLPISMSV